jgi:hypothetical protein
MMLGKSTLSLWERVTLECVHTSLVLSWEFLEHVRISTLDSIHGPEESAFTRVFKTEQDWRTE